MKRHLLSATLTIIVMFAYAQDYTCDSLILNVTKPIENLRFTKPFSMEMRDGSQLTCLPMEKILGYYSFLDYGCWFYKINPQDPSVNDSVLVETNNNCFFPDNQHILLFQDPEDEGYVFARLVYSLLYSTGNDGQAWLQLNHFDDDLNFQSYEDAVMVPLEDTVVKSITGEFDGENIMIMYVYNRVSPVVTRIGLDGTVREKVVYEGLFDHSQWASHGFVVYNDSPREYAIYDWDVVEGDTCKVYHVLDSLLNPMEDVVVNCHVGDIYPVKPGLPHILAPIKRFDMISLDDNTFVEVLQYERHNITRNGVGVLKFDKASHSCLANAQFESWPYYSNPYLMGYPIGIKKSTDGNLYLAYRTNAHETNLRGWIGVAKLDTDLNVIWQRYCLGSWSTTTGYEQLYCGVSLTADGFLVGGRMRQREEPYKIFQIFINDEGINCTPEAETFFRPYAYWPNPAQDRLHLQYSPDVKPMQVELYDLQGRLVRTQSKELESLNLQGLSAGTYTMRVTLEDGKAFSDKVVKE